MNALVNNQHKMVDDLRRLGIQEGDRIFVHSSFKKIGLSDGGAAAVVAALQKAVGAKGTLGMPVFPFCFSPDGAFDLATSPSKVGAITEVFRQTKGVVRSYSPSHSVAFWGQDAEYLASGHADNPPYAMQGPFGKLYDLNFKIVMLGCGLAPNSMIHAIEDWAGLPYTRNAVTTCYCKSAPDKEGRLYHCMPVGHRDFYIGAETSMECKYAKVIRQHGKLHSGTVGQAPSHWMYSRDLVDVSMVELDQRPDLFLCDKPECSSCVSNKNELNVWLRNGGSRWDWVRLGRARVCITPGVDTWSNHGMGAGVLCEGVLDDLYARVFLFRKGFRKWVIVTTDLLQTPR
ncbi:MAG: AAC(3) family N-acetyltransferase, partial [Phycisphaerae bacterium]